MGDLAARLADYGLTLDEHVVICDRRVVDEAVAALSAASPAPAPALPEDVERVVERLRNCADDPMWANHAEIPKPWCEEAAALIQSLSSQLAEAQANFNQVSRTCGEYLDQIDDLKAERDRLAADNERLRKALNQIDALDPEEHIYGCSHDATRGLVIEMGRLARAALASLEERG